MGYRPADRDQLAAAFGHPGVADAYQHRPPYPSEVFDILERIIADRPRRVLDLGAGEGALARPLASRVDHVDALDVSAAMVEAGRRRPGGGRRRGPRSYGRRARRTVSGSMSP
jgi:predicted TPR repeat methyltransferase